MRQVRINIQTLANSKGIRKEKRNGRDVVIVPSATLPDNVVMNGIRYPADEIEKSYRTLERTPAPFGHPKINGVFVSARDPEGINVGYVGAWNENVRRKDGRVYMDKVIDVEVASRSDNGKRLLDAIDNAKPIHTSTGLIANLVETGEEEPKYAVSDILFDHDAILLDEEGAATPEQGVGMFVNGKSIDVINSSLEENIDEQLDWAVDHIARTLEQKARVPMLERLKSALMEAFSMSRETSSREQENADMADEKKVADLESRMTTFEANMADLAKAVAGIGTTVTNAVAEAFAGIKSDVEVLTNAHKAEEASKKTALVNKIVEAGVLSKDAAEAMPIVALNELAEKVKPGKAAVINAGPFQVNANDEFAGYDLNAAIEKDAK